MLAHRPAKVADRPLLSPLRPMPLRSFLICLLGCATTLAAVLAMTVAMAAAAKPVPAAADAGKVETGAGTIYVVINDAPLTAYSVDQRIKLLSLEGGGWQQRLQARLHAPDIQDRFKAFAIAHKPKSKEDVIALQKQFVDGMKQQAIAETRPGMRDRAISQLVNEALERSEAKRLGVLASDDELTAALTEIAQRNKKSLKDFETSIVASGINLHAFRERIRGQMSWQRVLGQRFRGQISVANSELDQEVAIGSTSNGSESGAIELKLQRILIPLKSADAAASVEGYAAAEKLRQQAKPCNNLAQLAKQIAGARFDDLGSVNPQSLPGEVRSILASADAGSVPPPIISKSGIEIYGVCERIAAAQGEAVRTAARSKIEKQKFEALSKALLSDLCAAASIEPRNGFKLSKPCGTE